LFPVPFSFAAFNAAFLAFLAAFALAFFIYFLDIKFFFY